MESSLLYGFSIEEQKDMSVESLGVEYLSSTTEKPSYPLKTFIYGSSLIRNWRCFCNLIGNFGSNPSYNLIFLVDTGNLLIILQL